MRDASFCEEVDRAARFLASGGTGNVAITDSPGSKANEAFSANCSAIFSMLDVRVVFMVAERRVRV